MSVTGPASLGAKILARFSSETMLGFTGCAMACASGCFALYMNMSGPSASSQSGPHYFTVFAQFSARAHRGKVDTSPGPTVAMTDDIDPMVTGSIRERAAKGDVTASPHRRDAYANGSEDKPILTNVILRQVDGDSALVEMNDSLSVYNIGDVIPGAGRLIAMTRQNGRPALETSTGLIVESR